MKTLNQMCAALGLPIPANAPIPEDHLFGLFKLPITIASNSTTANDLTGAGVINGDKQIAKYFGTAADPEVIVQVNAARLVIDDFDYSLIDGAEKTKISNAYLQYGPQGDTYNYSLRGHVVDPFTDRTVAVADDGARLAQGKWLVHANPHRIDPRRDTWTIEWDAASPTHVGGLGAYLEIFGCVVPNNVAGGRKVGGADRWGQQMSEHLNQVYADILRDSGGVAS